MRKAVSMFVALSVLAGMSIIGYRIAETAKFFGEGAASLKQSEVLVRDISEILGKMSSKEFGSLSAGAVSVRNGNVKITLFIHRVAGMSPIDFLKTDIPLKERKVLNAIVLDALDPDLEERIPGSEIAAYDMSFQQGDIGNLEQFMKIVSRYEALTGDASLRSADWSDAVSFYPSESYRVVANFSADGVNGSVEFIYDHRNKKVIRVWL